MQLLLPSKHMCTTLNKEKPQLQLLHSMCSCCVFYTYGSDSAGRGKCLLNGIFFLSRRLVWLNQTILTTSVDLWSLIMTVWFYKSWIWPLLSKNNTFYCTLNLTQFSNFTVTLTLSCYQTWWDGLDLTCSSSRGLNFDDFPFFYFLDCTSGSRISPV